MLELKSFSCGYGAFQAVHELSLSLRPGTIEGFLQGVRHVFQPGRSKRLSAVYHFTFAGEEQREATITIHDQTLSVSDGHVGKADLHVTADSATWLGFLRKERSILWALLMRRIRLRGPLKLLIAFGKCFPQ